MKRIFLIFFSLLFPLLLTPNLINASSIKVEGKNITLIDFPGYKHDGFEIAKNIQTINGLDVHDVLIPLDASTPALQESNVQYNDFFVVATQPKMLLGFDLSVDDFLTFKDNIATIYLEEGYGYSAETLNKEYGDRIEFSLEEVSTPRIFLNESDRIGITSVTKFDGVNINIVNFTVIMLIKGKIIWVAYYDEYSSTIAYENAITRCLDFVERLARANVEFSYADPNFLNEYKKYANLDYNEDTKKISSIGYQKAYGLEYHFEIPISWEEKKSVKAHVVHSFKKITEQIYINMNITLDDSFSALSNDFDFNFSIHDVLEDPKDLIPSGAILLNSGITTIDFNRDAYFYEYSFKQPVLDGQYIEIYGYNILTLFDSTLVNIGFYVGGPSSDEFLSFAETLKPVFFKVLNTFRFSNKNKSMSSEVAKEIGKELSSSVNHLLWLAIAFPILMWTIIGLVFRFGVLHHSMKKNVASSLTIGVGLFSIIIMFFIVDDLGALGSVIGALLFYLVVRIGHSDYDKEILQIETEKARAGQISADAATKIMQAKQVMSYVKKIQEEAELSIHEKNLAEINEKKAQEAAEKAIDEIKRLEEELERVEERNKRLEQEAQTGSFNTGLKMNIVKDQYYYQSILDLPDTFSLEQLKKHFREKTVLYHPDKVSFLGKKLQAIAEEEMKEINSAYRFLQDYWGYQ